MPDDFFTELARRLAGTKPSVAPSSGKTAAYKRRTKSSGKPDYDSLYDKYGQEWDVDPDLLIAQGQQESSFKNNAVSSAGARGLGQFMPDTAAEFKVNVNDPASSIRGQAQLMRKLLDRTNDVGLSLAGYNSGHNASIERLKLNAERIPETRDYIKKILGNYGQSAQPEDVYTALARQSMSKPPQQETQEDVYTALARQSMVKPEGTPTPEKPDTLIAQIESANDPNVRTRFGVLATEPTQATLFANQPNFKPFETKEGTLWLNTAKIYADKKLRLKNEKDLQQYLKNPKALTTLIGITEDVGRDTQGTAVVAKKGNVEQASAIVRSPETAEQQIAAYQDQFPDAEIGITTSDDVVRSREVPGFAQEVIPPDAQPYDIPVTNNAWNAIPAEWLPKTQKQAKKAVTPIPQRKVAQNAVKQQEAPVIDEDVTVIPDDFTERVEYRDAPKGTDKKEYAIQQLIPRIANRIKADSLDVENALRELGGDYDAKDGINFKMTPGFLERVDKFRNNRVDVAERTKKSDADFEARKQKIDPVLSEADRDLEEFRLRGMADIDAGLITPEKQVEAYEKLKKDVETWKEDRGFLGSWRAIFGGEENTSGWNQQEWADFQRFLGGRPDTSNKPASESYQPSGLGKEVQSPKDYFDKAYADMQKQYGSASNWVKAQKEFKKRFENAPMSYLMKQGETAVGGAMQAPFQGAASALKSIAIGAEAIDKAIGGDQREAKDRYSWKLAESIEQLMPDVDKDFDDSNAKMLGNVFGQVVIQSALGMATGGALAPAAFGAGQGIATGYEQGTKEGLDGWTRLGKALVGGLIEAPDYFVFKGMLKGGNALNKIGAIQSLKATVERGLIAKGVLAPAAEKMAVAATDGFVAELIAKGGFKGLIGKGLQVAATKGKIGALEAIQEGTTRPLNDLWAYISYDRSPERWEAATSLQKSDFIEGVAGFFGGIVGAGLADIQTRAEGLSPEAVIQAQEFLKQNKDVIPEETYNNAQTALENRKKYFAKDTEIRTETVAETPVAKKPKVKVEEKPVEKVVDKPDAKLTTIDKDEGVAGTGFRQRKPVEKPDVSIKEPDTKPVDDIKPQTPVAKKLDAVKELNAQKRQALAEIEPEAESLEAQGQTQQAKKLRDDITAEYNAKILKAKKNPVTEKLNDTREQKDRRGATIPRKIEILDNAGEQTQIRGSRRNDATPIDTRTKEGTSAPTSRSNATRLDARTSLTPINKVELPKKILSTQTDGSDLKVGDKVKRVVEYGGEKIIRRGTVEMTKSGLRVIERDTEASHPLQGWSKGNAPLASAVNASGESAASLEAQSRLKGEQARGEYRVVVDTRSGAETKLFGVNAVDHFKLQPYQQTEWRGGKRDGEIIDRGTATRAYTRRTAPLASAAQPFYSRTESVIRDKMPPRATASQITALLAKNSVKELDPEFQAVKVWLDGQSGTVNKDAVMEFVEANRTVVNEVVKGGGIDHITYDQLDRNDYLDEDAEGLTDEWRWNVPKELEDQGVEYVEISEYDDKTYEINLSGNVVYSETGKLQDALDWLEKRLQKDYRVTFGDDLQSGGETKFAQWQLPGESENYREEFLTAPVDRAEYRYEVREMNDERMGKYHTVWNITTDENAGWGFPKRDKESMTKLAKELNSQAKGYAHEQNTWKDGHDDYSDVTNPIVRIRYNDRTTTDGDKMLFAEEFQLPTKENLAKMPKVYQKFGEQMAIRKMLYRAVEGGYDYFGFTTGQQQADRYDLSKQVQRIQWNPSAENDGGSTIVHIKASAVGEDIHLSIDAEGKVIGQIPDGGQSFRDKPLDDVVGKDIAKKILDEPKGTLEGLDLKVGGEGLINRYDRKHVDYINKLMAPYGVSVESKQIETATGRPQVETWDNLRVVEHPGEYELVARNKNTGHDDVSLGFFDTKTEADAELAIYSDKQMAETIHAVRISPEFKKAVQASMRDNGGAFPLTKVPTKATPEMELAATQDTGKLARNSKLTVEGSMIMLDNLDAYGLAHQAMQIFDPNYTHFFGVTLDGGQIKTVRDAMKEFAKTATFTKAELTGFNKFIKAIDTAAKANPKPTVKFILMPEAIAHESAHEARIQTMATASVEGSQSKDWIKGVVSSPLFKRSTIGDRYGKNSDAVQALEFIDQLIAKSYDELGLDPDTDANKIVDAIQAWADDFIKTNGEVDWKYYEKLNEVNSHLISLISETKGGDTKNTVKQEAERGEAKADSETARAEPQKPTADVKIREYSNSLREAGFADAPLVPYVPGTDNAKAIAVNHILEQSDPDMVEAEKLFYAKTTDPKIKGVLGTALIDHLGSLGEIDRMLKIAKDTVEHIGTAAQILQTAKLVGKYDFASGMMMISKAAMKAGRPLTVREVNKAQKLLGDVASTEEDKAAVQFMVNEMKAAIVAKDVEIVNLTEAIEKQQQLSDAEIADLKKKLAAKKPTTKKETLASRRGELEASIRAKYGNAPMAMAVKSEVKLDQDLVDLATLDIFDGLAPDQMVAHLREVTKNNLSDEQIKAIHIAAWKATGYKSEPTLFESLKDEDKQKRLELREKAKARRAHIHAVNELLGKEKESKYVIEVREFGKANGYTDGEIIGALTMPKLKGNDVVTQWKQELEKQGFKDVDFKRAYHLRQVANTNIRQRQIQAKAEREQYVGDLKAFEHQLKRANAINRDAKSQFDAYAKKTGRNWAKKGAYAVTEGIAAAKGLSTWGEISYVLRQGFVPLMTDTRVAIKGDWQGVGHGLQGDNKLIQKAAKGIGLDELAEYLNDHNVTMFIETVREHPMFAEAQNNGIRFTQIGDFNLADDHFSVKALEKIPLYKRTELAYTLPGDLQRLYMYENWARMIDGQNLDAIQRKTAKKYAAETINAFTGKGDVKRILQSNGPLAKLLNVVFFSPQLLVSRFQTVNRLTTGFATAPKGMKWQMAKKGMRFYTLVGLLAFLSGMVLDPEDEDFGDVRVGDTNINFLAGLDVPAQLYGRTAVGFGKALYTGDKNYIGDALLADSRQFLLDKRDSPRFVRGKMSPGMSAVYDWYDGKDFIGRPVTLWGAVTTRVAPLSWQQVYDALLYDRYQAMVKEPNDSTYAWNKLNKNERNYANAFGVMAGSFLGLNITQYPKYESSKGMQLARLLSPVASNKDAETLRQESGLRNLLKAQIDTKDPKATQAIKEWLAKYPALKAQEAKLRGQAKSKTGLLSYYAKDLNLEQLKRVLEVATDVDEKKVIQDLIYKQTKKK